MKDWIKKINDSYVTALFDKYKSLEKVPKYYDKDIYEFIDKYLKKRLNHAS